MKIQNTIKRLSLKVERIEVKENSAAYDLPMTNPSDVAKIAHLVLKHQEQESFLVFYLNVKNKLIGFSEVAKGSIDSCPVDPRVVFRTAIFLGCSSVIFVHNHPSDDVFPSNEDIDLTERLAKAGRLLNVPVFDHIIVSDRNSFSFAEHGIMP